jgi:N-acetylglutamate synthase-like GNAT family acetyltransferase
MATTEIRIRRATRNDGEHIWKVHTTAIRETCRSRYSEEEIAAWTSRLAPDTYDSVIRGKAMYVAQSEDEVVGFGQLDVVKGEVEALYVRPEFSGEGVGSRLLRMLEVVAQECGLKRLFLDSSLNAEKFYQFAGYQSREETMHPLSGGLSIAAVRMEKVLPAEF